MKPINPSDVPENLRHLIPLAMQFGHTDDLTHESRVWLGTPHELNLLRVAIAENDDAFDDWLAGPAANGLTYSDAYIAFSAMRMTADFVGQNSA
jgi:hypothetical protein